MNKIADGYTHLTSVYYYNNCIIASEDLIRNEQDKTLSLRKRRIDEFFLKKRLHLNELTNINSDNCLELQKGDLTIPIEQQLDITSLVNFFIKLLYRMNR